MEPVGVLPHSSLSLLFLVLLISLRLLPTPILPSLPPPVLIRQFRRLSKGQLLCINLLTVNSQERKMKMKSIAGVRDESGSLRREGEYVIRRTVGVFLCFVGLDPLRR